MIEDFERISRWYAYGFGGVTEQAAKMDPQTAAAFIIGEVKTFIACDPNYRTQERPEDAARFAELLAFYICGRTDEQREQTKKTKQI